MAQVCPLLSACAVRADWSSLQLATLYRLVSSRCVCRSLRHLSGPVSHRIRRCHCRSRDSNRPQRLSTPLARPNGLLTSTSTWCVRLADVLIPDACRTSLDAVGVDLRRRFAVRLA